MCCSVNGSVCCMYCVLFYRLLDLSCGECNVISFMFCVALSMDLDLFVLCIACMRVFVNCLWKQFAICWVWLLFYCCSCMLVVVVYPLP